MEQCLPIAILLEMSEWYGAARIEIETFRSSNIKDICILSQHGAPTHSFHIPIFPVLSIFTLLYPVPMLKAYNSS